MPRSRLFARLHFAAFGLALALWTVALWMPVPTESANKALGSPWWAFLFGKTLHVSVYCFLTVLGATALMRFAKWGWIPPVLVLHGMLTEFVQQFVGRTGSIRDLLLDSSGILIGSIIVIGWNRLSARRAMSATSSNPEPIALSELSRPHRPPIAVPSPTIAGGTH